MQFLKSFYENRVGQAHYPNQDVIWSGTGLAFYGDLTHEQTMAHAERFLRGNHKAGIRRALDKGAFLFIEHATGNRMDVDWFAASTVDLTLFEEESLRRLVNAVQSDVQALSSRLIDEGRQLTSGVPLDRTLVRSISTERFVVEVFEVPPATDLDLSGEEVESIYRDIEAGRQRFLGLEVAVKAAGMVLGAARAPGFLNDADDQRYGGVLHGLTRQAIEDTRDFIAGVTL
jgi:hypothetical protein